MKSSYHVEFRRIPRQSKFHIFRGKERSAGHLELYEWVQEVPRVLGRMGQTMSQVGLT